jgi:hypothetical protein
MKKIKFICSILFFIVVVTGCTKIEGLDQDLSFLSSVSTSNPSKIFDISTDNSGNVKITPLADGAVSFTVNFGHGTGAAASAVVSPGGSAVHSYPEGTYTVSIDAVDIAGVTTNSTYPLTVTYRAPEDVTIKIESNMVVSATALYAKSFLVYFGDVANEVGTPLAIGAKLPSHTYPVGGPFDLKVVALSGGAAKTEVIKTLFGLPLTFESTTMNYFFGTFGADQGFEKVANPLAAGLNTSATVGKFIRGDEGWSGTYSPLDIPLDFALGKKIKMLVYNPDAALIGKKVNCELESAVGGKPANGVAVKRATVTKSGEWEELTFDFSTFTTTEIPANTRFNQFVLRYNVTAAGPVVGGKGTILYIDNISFTN